MIRATIIVFLFGLFACAGKQEQTDTDPVEPKKISATISTFPITANVRAITATDENTLWYAGSDGQFGYTTDAGQSWNIDSIKHEGRSPEFRSIVVTAEAVMILSVASPALLYRSTDQGQSWEITYQEDDTSAFYNAMAFWDDNDGIAVGDPIEGCLSVIRTHDGGLNWTKLSCEQLPTTADGEAGFAASNTNISLSGDNVWLVSGGAKARVFHSPDRGESWQVYETPIIQGGQMTGIFTSAFWDENKGVIFGGDWNAKEQNTKNKATSTDGGKTWQLVSDGAGPGYRSCVQYIPGSNGEEMLAIGSPGISYSADSGASWSHVSDSSFYTVRIPAPGTAWLAGAGKIGRMEW